VTVAHVVDRAGVSRRTFYELYEDRESCFLAAFDDGLARACQYVLDGYDPHGRWVAKVRMTLAGLLAFLDAEPTTGWLLVVGSLGAGGRALERRRVILERMIALVDEGREQSKTSTRLPSLTAEGIVGGVLSVLHARLQAPAQPNTPQGNTGGAPPSENGDGSLLGLTSPLMSMIVLPYLGAAAAQRELGKPVSAHRSGAAIRPGPADPLQDVHMRLTYRTVRVLMAIAALDGRGIHPSNREVGLAAEVPDQGQISKLLTRLARLGLIQNSGTGLTRGAPNAWTLTTRGEQIERAIGGRSQV
jgi:AcrR family transcriptional regulator